MTTPKCMVCTCEDVTEEEVRDAIRAGYADIESLKRYTGLATGPCQGKSCVQLTRILLHRETGVPLEEIGAITYRPPLKPVPLGFLAGREEKEEEEG